MVLENEPERPKWKFREPNTYQQMTLDQFPGVSLSAGRTATTSTLADEQIQWQAPVDVTLVRKGFLVRTNAPQNAEIVRRLLRDLTMHYPESNYERNRRKHNTSQFWSSNQRQQTNVSNKPPLHVFCSYTGEDLADHNAMAEQADWQLSLQNSENRALKPHRARGSLHLLVPKFFLLEQLRGRPGVQFHDANLSGKPMAAHVHFTPRRQLVETERRPQVSATNFALHHLRRTGGAVLVLPVGCGKTVCALYCAMQLRVCTLIVVGTENLIEQWRERIAEYCIGARIGRIQSDVCITEDCDFVIACTKSLTERSYSTDALRNIGMTIFDEAHHAAATTVTTAIWQSASPYMLALSADPQRDDGMTDVLYRFFSYNVYIVPPSLPDGIELHILVHQFNRRCFVQDADCVSANRLRDRRHNAANDAEKLEYCEALCSFDKRHYASATLAAAQLVGDEASASRQTGIPGVGALHALSSWQQEFCEKDVEHLNYTQVYQQLQCDAHRNATILAYTMQLLATNGVDQLRKPDVDDCNRCSVPENLATREFVNVEVDGQLKPVTECSRDDLQRMKQVERQILILASEKQHIDSLYDRFVRSGVPAEIISVFVGGENKTGNERTQMLSRRIILGTYAIAAEGLDIATLNTIVFASPRASVIAQAIGRALRDKLRPELMPVIVDFRDCWSKMAQGMFYKRKSSAYRHYSPFYHTFDDYASYDAIGPVCWKKPRQTRTQRQTAERKRKREEEKAARDAERQRLKLEKQAEKEQAKAEKARLRAEKSANRKRKQKDSQ